MLKNVIKISKQLIYEINILYKEINKYVTKNVIYICIMFRIKNSLSGT